MLFFLHLSMFYSKLYMVCIICISLSFPVLSFPGLISSHLPFLSIPWPHSPVLSFCCPCSGLSFCCRAVSCLVQFCLFHVPSCPIWSRSPPCPATLYLVLSHPDFLFIVFLTTHKWLVPVFRPVPLQQLKRFRALVISVWLIVTGEASNKLDRREF